MPALTEFPVEFEKRQERIAMKHIPSVVIAWLLAGAVAACLASQNLYGQGLSNRSDAMQIWREAAMNGLSYNESLALYRLRQSATVPTPLHPRFQVGAGATVYRPQQPTRYGVAVTPSYPTTIARAPVGKPFANVRPAPTAFERYWPLMLEGREDPNTGIIIWSLP
jgi:hypothetical protein